MRGAHIEPAHRQVRETELAGRTAQSRRQPASHNSRRRPQRHRHADGRRDAIRQSRHTAQRSHTRQRHLDLDRLTRLGDPGRATRRRVVGLRHQRPRHKGAIPPDGHPRERRAPFFIRCQPPVERHLGRERQ